MSRDAREAASDRRSTFGTAMTREQIEALSDDPDEMAQQLQDIAGGNAVIRVDSFEGGRLPPKSAIKAIHITRDAFAAENHFAGGLFIDIITQPGIGPLRTNMNMRLRDGSLSGKPHVQLAARSSQGARAHAELQRRPRRLADQAEGVVLDQRQQHTASSTRPYLHYYTPDGVAGATRSAPRRPRDNMFVFGLFDYAITQRPDAARQLQPEPVKTRKDIGVGGYDLLERGYTTEDQQRLRCASRRRGRSAAASSSTRARRINWSDSSNRTRCSRADDPRDRRDSRAAASS